MDYKMQNTAYVLDFDGTVTRVDISTELAMEFGGQEFKETEKAYFRKEIGMREWLTKACSVLPPDLHHLVSLSLKKGVLRPGFIEFLKYVRSRSGRVFIASDGLGFYIEPLLEKFGCRHLIDGIYMNKTIKGKDGLELIIGNAHPNCRICGSCKAAQVLKLEKEGYRVIYVGDGMNDRFGASWADQVFARDRMAEYMRRSGRPYQPWSDFFDLLNSPDPAEEMPDAAPLCDPEGGGLRIFE